MHAKPLVLSLSLALSLFAFQAPAQQSASLSVDPDQEGLSILFDLGGASIRSDQQEVLDQASRLFRDGNPVVMIVTGSADTVGSASENLDLSIRRARNVADGLVARGIPIERLQVLGRGNSELPVPTDDGVANEENRSVLINWR
ncbi:OmpA family protein [Palleronia sp. LCG004]|uniref:OmpA family protein n=1 Tax=Palleronia sp. LCG004 TaxID=3079304 RepID=UPI0029420079|nr:OmpA family protein [Palleronia sp. LCG004]WOI57685.1 OmpA family protein [Palleronia sp. LCG004]